MNYTSKSALQKHASIIKKQDMRSAISVLVISKSIRRIIKLKLVENNYLGSQCSSSMVSAIFARNNAKLAIPYSISSSLCPAPK